MMKFRENEDAVSPVIGVILMVAITVILAAIIAMFAFEMTENIPANKEVYVTATQTGNATAPMVTVKLFGGKDVGLLKNVTVSITKANGTDGESNDGESKELSGVTVGSYATLNLDEGQNTVVVVAHFTDGTEQIVLDKVFTVAAAP